MMKADIRWLDNPEIFRVNREDAHSDHAYYASYNDMEKKSDRWVMLLDGLWKFRYSKNAASRPADFYKEGYDDSNFDMIRVPGHIELQGYDKIQYINTMYPWEGHEYRRPAYSIENAGNGAGMFSEASYNPVGSYVCTFDLPETFQGNRVYVCFEGVEQAMYIWLNGEFIGYAEDSFTPSEFDLTPYIRTEGNKLCVEVHKRSTAAFLEDQDFFRFFGIFRSVKLKAKPCVHVEDIFIRPILWNSNIQGNLEVNAKLSMVYAKDIRVTAVLRDKGKICWSQDMKMQYSDKGTSNILQVTGALKDLSLIHI